MVPSEDYHGLSMSVEEALDPQTNLLESVNSSASHPK